MSQRIGVCKLLKVMLGFTICLHLVCITAATSWGMEGKPLQFALLGSDAKVMAAVDFELQDLNGTTIRLSKYKGEKAVLVYFWATWCPYCIAAKPELAKLRQRLGPNEMEILGINVGGGDTLEKVKRYQEGHPVAWPVLFDSSGTVTRAYQVQGIPLFVLVSKEGDVIFRDNALPTDIGKYLK